MSRIPLPPAPGATDHTSLALVNSAVSLPGGHAADDLGSPAEATAWLVGQRLVPEETALLAYCQGRLTTLRGNLRALFSAHVQGVAPAPQAVEGINQALLKVPSALLLQYDAVKGLLRVARHPVTQLVEHATAQLAEDAAALLTGGQAGLLAQCEAASCDRFFLRTHARRCWCSTRCGDRVRAARAYARKQERARLG